LYHLSEGIQVDHLLIWAKLRRTWQYDVVGLSTVVRNLIPTEGVHKQLLLVILRTRVQAMKNS
jgi:hypothetical protein